MQKKNALPEADDEALRAVFIEEGSPFFFTGKDFLTYQLYVTRDVAEGIRRNATKAVSDLASHAGAPARAMSWTDADKMYAGKVFIRGNPQTLGAEAPRQFLTVLQSVSPEPFPKDQSGRLQLAQAIASKSNPLHRGVQAARPRGASDFRACLAQCHSGNISIGHGRGHLFGADFGEVEGGSGFAVAATEGAPDNQEMLGAVIVVGTNAGRGGAALDEVGNLGMGVPVTVKRQ